MAAADSSHIIRSGSRVVTIRRTSDASCDEPYLAYR